MYSVRFIVHIDARPIVAAQKFTTPAAAQAMLTRLKSAGRAIWGEIITR